jgi:hypothetical protein
MASQRQWNLQTTRALRTPGRRSPAPGDRQQTYPNSGRKRKSLFGASEGLIPGPFPRLMAGSSRRFFPGSIWSSLRTLSGIPSCIPFFPGPSACFPGPRGGPWSRARGFSVQTPAGPYRRVWPGSVGPECRPASLQCCAYCAPRHSAHRDANQAPEPSARPAVRPARAYI